jgi:hypothetical protein
MINDKLDKGKIGIVAVLVTVFLATVVYAYLRYAPFKNDNGDNGDEVNLTTSKKEKIAAYKEAYAARSGNMRPQVGQSNKTERENQVAIDFSKLLKEDEEKVSPVEKTSVPSENTQEEEKQKVYVQNKEDTQSIQEGYPKKLDTRIVARPTRAKSIKEEKAQEIREKEAVPKRVFVRNTVARDTLREQETEVIDKTPLAMSGDIAVPAIVYGDQKVKAGATVRLRTTEAVSINELMIPANTFVFGTVRLAKERIYIHVARLKVGEDIVPFKMTAYDIDNMEGLYAPENVEQAIARDTKNAALNGVQSTVNIPIIGSLSVNAGKKKIGDPEVKIPNRYKLNLRPQTN